MSVIEHPEVIGLGRIRRAHLAWLDFQLGLSQAASFDEDLIYEAMLLAYPIALLFFAPPQIERYGADSQAGALSSSNSGFLSDGSVLFAIATVVYEGWVWSIDTR